MPSLDQIVYFFNLQPNPGIILKYEAPKFIVVHLNPVFAKAMNVVPGELLGEDFFKEFPISPYNVLISANEVRDALEYALNFKEPHQFTKQKDNRIYKIDTYPLLDDHGEVEYIVQNSEEILVKGIDEIHTLVQKYHPESVDYSSVPGTLIGQEFLERRVLALNSTAGVLIDEVLSNYVEGIERLFPDMHCSIMKVKNQHIYSWISSSLPEVYLTQIDGVEIGDKVGSCGAAAFLKQRIIVSDIQSDLRWEGYKQYALASNLRACWSHPILNSSDEVIATFAIYYREVREPNYDELMVIERASSILKIILESRQREEDLSDAAIVIEHHHLKVRDIAWSQTHLLRAPLARILGLVKLLGLTDKGVVEERQIISYLEDSAIELDKVIKDIIDKSKE